MRKVRIHFEQIPVDVVKKIAAVDLRVTPTYCWICGNAVRLEQCKIDAQGQAIHEKCYVAKLVLEKGALQPKAVLSKSSA